jgi:hypothetical protein
MNRTGAAVRAAGYLVVPAGEPIELVFISRQRFALTQQGNPNTVVIHPSGVFDQSCLVAGKIRTISEHREAQALFRDYAREVTRGFKKIRNYRVGPEALQLMQKGKRLVTIGATERTEYDLRE